MNYQSFKGRSIDFTQQVEIYKNLHNGLWSVRQNGLVVAHLESFKLNQVFFRVSEVGRQRVIKEKKKNVHAFICGLLEESMVNFITPDKEAFHVELVEATKLYYNPYRTERFMIKRPNGNDFQLYSAKKCIHYTLTLVAGKAGIAAIL